MKNIKFLLFIIILIFSNVLLSQDMSSLSKNLISLEQHIDNKQFKKQFKKHKKNWELSCNQADSIINLIKNINILSKIFSDATLLEEGSEIIPFNFNYIDLCNQLLNLELNLFKDNLSFSKEELDEWKRNINQLIDAENKRILALQEYLRNKISAEVKSEFNNMFLKVLKFSENKEIKEVSEIKFINANINITTDNDDISQYEINYNVNKDKELSKNLHTLFIEEMKSNLPKQYKKTNLYDMNCLDRKMTVFEFQGEKFAETAKRSTISIGILKDNYNVFVYITEPVFR
jgi:hypothetical protein